MQIELLTRRELEVINRRNHRYPLQIAEKEYLLSVVSRIIAGSELRGRLVFKGGTALHHCYLPNLRFSEDLDFTYAGDHPGDGAEILREMEGILEEHDFLSVRKSRVSDFTIKIERLSFTGPLGQPNSMKVEVDIDQVVVMPPRENIYGNVWRVDTRVMVMDIREMCAEKIRAANERARYRDFYDLYMILERFEIDMGEVSELIARKESRAPLSKSSIEANWTVALGEKEKDGSRIFYLQEVPDSRIEEMLDRL
ncbi:MAG: nucleotidyl transferase AbiEii/AbiGii toxin family protein [Actinomycetota bacterium]|nr:nucleotidyl transferase AbiEii/AbiGii toxin family protein [Actinomycetota bacterium]